MEKSRTLAPDCWGAHQRNDFSEPRLLHLPIHRKTLNSLTWDVWFSLMNSNLLMFWLPVLCCKKPLSSLAPPWPLWSGPSEHLRGCLPRLSPQKVHQIKQNSQLSGRWCFFQLTLLTTLCSFSPSRVAHGCSGWTQHSVECPESPGDFRLNGKEWES